MESERTINLTWCKDRAMEYLPSDPAQALASFLSDMKKHDDTAEIINNPSILILISEVFANLTAQSVEKFVIGFN